MSNLDEIKKCLQVYKKRKNKKIILLHCVSNYPSSKESLNIKNLNVLQSKFKHLIGYSDHSEGNKAIMLSVALGAVVIEKHFTINKSLSGPDQKTSILPNEFKKMVSDIKETKVILGSEQKKCQNEEKEMLRISRKSLTLVSDIKKNQKILKQNLTLKRPGTGIYYANISKILGKKAKYNLKKDYQIKIKDVKK